MRCGVCRAPLRVRTYRMTGGRRVPLYYPCPRLTDPAAHPAAARARAKLGQPARAKLVQAIRHVVDETQREVDETLRRAEIASNTRPWPTAPWPRGTVLRFLGTGPFAWRLPAGTTVVVRDVVGTRSVFSHGDLAGAIWPERAGDWQVT